MLATLLLAATLSIEDYVTMPQLSAPRVAPDGARIAYVVTKADLAKSAYDADVWVIGADGKNHYQLTRAGGADNAPRWSPDGKQLAFLSDRNGPAQVFVIEPGAGEARQLTSEPAAIREHAWSPDGKSIAFLRIDEVSAAEKQRAADKDDARVLGDNAKHVHLYVADVASGKVRRLTSGATSIFAFSWSPDSKAIAFDRGTGTGLDDYYRTDIYTVRVDDGTLTPLVVRPGIDHLPVWSPDGKSIAFLSAAGRSEWLVEHRLHIVPAAGGASRDIGAAVTRAAERILWSPDAKVITFDGPIGSTSQLFRVQADGTGFTQLTDVDGVIEDADASGGRVAYIFQSFNDPPELYVDGKRLTHHNDGLRTRERGETRVLRWKNPKDGLEIEGFLTLPPGYKAGTRLPLLTFVHGGPGSRFWRGFFGYLGNIYVPHVLAAQGFAVLRPNPRGTGGYSESFFRANLADWGGMDWMDINAGIDRVIADGIADPNRLGIMGWSYGGYMATWALGHSDRFRRYSIGAPVVDLVSMHGTSDIRDFLPSYFGRTPLSMEKLRAHSPLWFLKKTDA